MRPGSASTGYDFDEIGRLKNFTQDFTGTADDLANTFTYNPASQVVNLRVGNDLYHYRGNTNRAGTYVPNGLNQYTSVGGISLGYDNNGNLTNDGTPTTYSYDEENRLLGTTSPSSAFQYDPLGRLFSATLGGVTTQFLYGGDSLVAEYVNNSLTRRYAHGDRVDEPWVQYEGAAVNSTTRRFLHADHQGSIVALSSNTGTAVNKLSYDAYGIPHNNNVGRFGYTGQIWMKEVGLFHYKARFYHPKLGRFLQTDPIFYEDQMNMYAYTGNDPVNMVDPTGKDGISVGLTMKVFGEGLTNTISIRYPGVSKEPFDIQLQTELSMGSISDFALDFIAPNSPLNELQSGVGLLKGSINFSWDFNSNEGSGMDLNSNTHIGVGLLGGTVSYENLLSDGAAPVPTSFELNLGPQLGASNEPGIEFTTSGRDLLNAGRNLVNSVRQGGNNSDNGMSGGNVRVCTGMGAEKGGCR